MKRHLTVAALTAALFAGGAGIAAAGPFDHGPGPGPGNSGENSVHGLCTAWAHNSDAAKEHSAVFSGANWDDICE